MDDETRTRVRRRAVIVAVGYGLLAGTYVIASSVLLGSLPLLHSHHTAVEALKGAGFVAVTAIVLGVVVHRDYAAILDAKAKLVASATALARAHTTASLSVVTGAIAHDMRNLLAAAMANLELLALESRLDSASEEVLGDIRESLTRLSSFTGDLLERAGRSGSRFPPAEVHVAKVVADCVRLTSLFARGHKCAIETSFDGDCVVRARRQELECAILNLLLNAVDANERKGKICVAVARRGAGVILRVRDEGPGVPEDIQECIFEPFFSTKGENGNGVGLSVTRGLVRSYGGDVRLSDPGPGAEFELALPAAS